MRGVEEEGKYICRNKCISQAEDEKLARKQNNSGVISAKQPSCVATCLALIISMKTTRLRIIGVIMKQITKLLAAEAGAYT